MFDGFCERLETYDAVAESNEDIIAERNALDSQITNEGAVCRANIGEGKTVWTEAYGEVFARDCGVAKRYVDIEARSEAHFVLSEYAGQSDVTSFGYIDDDHAELANSSK